MAYLLPGSQSQPGDDPGLCPLHIPVSNQSASLKTLKFHLPLFAATVLLEAIIISHFDYYSGLLTCFPIYSLAFLKPIFHTIPKMTFLKHQAHYVPAPPKPFSSLPSYPLWIQSSARPSRPAHLCPLCSPPRNPLLLPPLAPTLCSNLLSSSQIPLVVCKLRLLL